MRGSGRSSRRTTCAPTSPEFVKHKIADLGRYTIIDKLEARFDDFKGIYFASFANFTIGELTVSKEIVREYPKMLTGGIWAHHEARVRQSGG